MLLMVVVVAIGGVDGDAVAGGSVVSIVLAVVVGVGELLKLLPLVTSR